MIGRLGEKITIGCPEQERIKTFIEYERIEDIKNGATQRWPPRIDKMERRTRRTRLRK